MRISTVIQTLVIIAITSLPLHSIWADDFVVLDEDSPQAVLTTTLEAKRPQHVVDLLWYEGKTLCTDSLKLVANRETIRTGDNVTFRFSIARKCPAKRGGPQPIRYTFSVRNLQAKSDKPEHVEVREGAGNSAAFSYAFSRSHRYQVSVVSHYTEEETHTLSLNIDVAAREESP